MIAIDAMGGDFAPSITVQGAYNAAAKGINVALYGQEYILWDILKNIDKHWQRLPISLVNCTEVIGMAEEPTRSILKKDSSLMKALCDVAAHKAHAVVSAGNSGAVLVGSIIVFDRVKGVMRPALGTFIPTHNESLFLLDIGANVDCKPEYLEQFAYLGHLFVKQQMKLSNPRVALLSNGQERGKGCMANKQAYYLLEQSSLNFVGNIESRELFNGHTDVLVCDGFVGNIVLKAVQGTSTALTQWLKCSFKSSWYGTLVGALSKPFFKTLQQTIDYQKIGGALLLGVNYPTIIAHGCSNAYAFENAITFAHSIAQKKTLEHFNHDLERLLAISKEVKSTTSMQSKNSSFLMVS
jgi:glycerol-3-phosphate acyltransferase PlsX